MTTVEQKLQQLIGELQFQLILNLQKVEDQEKEIEKLKKEKDE